MDGTFHQNPLLPNSQTQKNVLNCFLIEVVIINVAEVEGGFLDFVPHVFWLHSLPIAITLFFQLYLPKKLNQIHCVRCHLPFNSFEGRQSKCPIPDAVWLSP